MSQWMLRSQSAWQVQVLPQFSCLLRYLRNVLVYKCHIVVWFSLVIVGRFVCFREEVLLFSYFLHVFTELFLKTVRVGIGLELKSSIQSSNSLSSLTCVAIFSIWTRTFLWLYMCHRCSWYKRRISGPYAELIKDSVFTNKCLKVRIFACQRDVLRWILHSKFPTIRDIPVSWQTESPPLP